QSRRGRCDLPALVLTHLPGFLQEVQGAPSTQLGHALFTGAEHVGTPTGQLPLPPDDEVLRSIGQDYLRARRALTRDFDSLDDSPSASHHSNLRSRPVSLTTLLSPAPHRIGRVPLPCSCRVPPAPAKAHNFRIADF